MWKTFARVSIGLAALSSVTTLYGAATVESQLLNLEQTWMKAAQGRDIGALRQILSDDYVDITYKGTLRDKAAALRGSSVSAKDYTQTLSEERVRIYGGIAIVTGRGVLTNTDQSYHAAWRFTDVFIKQDHAWRVVSSQETAE